MTTRTKTGALTSSKRKKAQGAQRSPKQKQAAAPEGYNKDIAAMLSLAREFLHDGNLLSARWWYQKAASRSTSIEVRLECASFFNQHTGETRVARDWLTGFEKDPQVFELLGTIRMREGRYDEALECFQRAVACGVISANYHIGVIKETVDRKPAAALPFYEAAARAGVVDAAFRRACLELEQQGQFTDESIGWFEMAEKAGSTRAAAVLAGAPSRLSAFVERMSSRGHWIDSYAQLAGDLESLSMEGEAFAQHALACLVLKRGAPGDWETARFWLEPAALAGFGPAVEQLRALPPRLPILPYTFRLKPDAKAFPYFVDETTWDDAFLEGLQDDVSVEKHIRICDTAHAQEAIGTKLNKGSRNAPGAEDCDWSFRESIDMLKSAASRGRVTAQYNLGCALMIDRGERYVGRYIDEAAEWFALASKNGHTAATEALAWIERSSTKRFRDRNWAELPGLCFSAETHRDRK